MLQQLASKIALFSNDTLMYAASNISKTEILKLQK